jgi:hypothetical protein
VEEQEVDKNNKIARIVGILFIIGTVAGILSMIGAPIIDGPDYLVKIAENKNILVLGALLILVMGISLSSMTVVLFPVLKEYNETLALGALVFRGALELVCYVASAASWLLLIALSQNFVSAGIPVESNFQLIGTILKDNRFIIGEITAILFSIGALFIYYIFYKTKLIPTWLSLWGIVGAIIYLADGIFSLFIFNTEFEFFKYILGVQEMIMAGWLIVKGFNKTALFYPVRHC